jgi:4-hydroxybenzoate polyprenyltransferase
MLFGYSYTKRFTWLSHFVLGFVQALSPLGVWLAVTGAFSLNILPLSVALGTYIAGFDLIYACQDVDFDRAEGLYSIPANIGCNKAFRLSTWLHIFTFLSLLSLYWIFSMSQYYLVFLIVIGLFLIVEHILVSPDDLSKIHIALFHVNGIIALLIFIAVLTEELLSRSYHP